MKQVWLSVFLLVLITGCVSTNKSLWDRHHAFVDPFVSKWLEAPSKQSGEVLPVLVISSAPLADYTFLKKIGYNHYTGHLTKAQLRQLMRDERVRRIGGGKQRLH